MPCTCKNIAAMLDARRKALGMSIRILANRCDISFVTVQHVLSGKGSERFDTLHKIAHALGMDIALRVSTQPREMQSRAARNKAKVIVGGAQGSFALEGQAVSSKRKRRIESKITKDLLHGPKIRLWS